MIRDFSEEKKKELYEALEIVDNKEWKPFMAWCGGRTGEFGEWVDRLGILSYTRAVDKYQSRILEINESMREQIDSIFENVTEVDRRYAETFREYQKTVKEQLVRVQAMADVMRDAVSNGVMQTMTLSEVEEDSMSDREKKILSGRELLMNRLDREGYSQTECKKICDMIMENNPSMLMNLYITDSSSGVDSDRIYSIIKEYYEEHKNDKKLDDAEKILNSYLISNGYTNSVEREFIIEMIREEYPNVLLNLYTTNNYSSSSNDAVVKTAINYYKDCIQVDSKNPYSLFYESAVLLGMKLDNDGNVIINSEEEKKEYYETIIMLSKGKVMGLPNVEGRFKSFMSYETIKLESSPAYKLQQIAVTDERGFRRVEVEGLSEPAYVVALGTYYTGGTQKVGDIFVVTFDDGNVIYCITGDVKQDIHTDTNNQYRLDGTDIKNANIIEFIIDTNNNLYLDELWKYGNVGQVSGCEDMSGAVVEIRKLDIPTLVLEE